MYFIDAVSVLLRRWYVLVAGLLLMGVGAGAVIMYVPTQYQASGQMLLLLPPDAAGTGKPINPYLNLQSGLTTAASLVSGSASTKDVHRDLKEQGFDSEYAVAVVPGTGPLITVTAKDTDQAVAVATRDAVMAWMSRELARIQDEVAVPRSQYMTAVPSSVGRRAEVLPGSKLRALAGVAALGGILTLGTTFGLDRLLRRRSARRPVAKKTKAAAAEEESAPQRTADGPVPIKRPVPRVEDKAAKVSAATKVSPVAKDSTDIKVSKISKASKASKASKVSGPAAVEDGKRHWTGRRTGSGG